MYQYLRHLKRPDSIALEEPWRFRIETLGVRDRPTPTGILEEQHAKRIERVTVTPSASSISATQALTVTVVVSAGKKNPTPTGAVTLTGGGYSSAATTLSGGKATIAIPAGTLGLGSTTLTAIYAPDASGSATYGVAMGTSAVTVTTATPD
jgi:hypothetical protein